MKTAAYIISGKSSSELLEDNLLVPLERGELRTRAAALFFVADGVYHLMKGARSSKVLRTLLAEQKTTIIGCQLSIKNRKLQNVLIDGLILGSLDDFYEAAKDADHIIHF